MHENMLATAARLSDEALLTHVRALSHRERDATVELIAHLAELEARRGHLAEGPGTLFSYCHEILGYSEDAAWNRAAAANAVRRYPTILEGLADGSLTLTTVRMLRPILTPGNHAAVLDEARHRSKREVELIVRRLDPRPDVASAIREMPRPRIAPLTPERYHVEFTISKEGYEKLRHVQDLLCREIPDGDPAAIFERALDCLVAAVEKKKVAATTRPRVPRGGRPGVRDIPPHVVREVWARDGAQCAFRGRAGRCTQRRYLELHHVQPYENQGPATVPNVSLRCRAHNVYESDLVFGRTGSLVVREHSPIYGVSRENASFRNDAGVQCGEGRSVPGATRLRSKNATT